MSDVRISAYILLADPHYLAASVASYYPLVDRIVACYDSDGLSWGGTPIDLSVCRAELSAVDIAGKVEFVSGRFSNPDQPLLVSDTAQRQHALNAASRDADWVIQLDTDEVALDPQRLVRAIQRADQASAQALDYPSRWLFAEVRPGRFVEASTRWGRPAMSYPGPLAVRAGTELTLARQQAGPLWRVDIRANSTDPAQYQSKVDEVIDVDQAVLHFSWVRSREELLRKAAISSHAKDFDWTAAIARWDSARTHPWRYALANPARRSSPLPARWLRPVSVPPVQALITPHG